MPNYNKANKWLEFLPGLPMNEQKIRERWYGGSPVSWGAKVAARFFGLISGVRRWCYQVGLCKIHQLKAPVIVVGNITAGGGGKTPMVMWLVEYLKSMGYRPGIISRGYGGKRKVEPMFVTANADPAASGDEPLLMAKKTQCPVVVGKDRVKAGQSLLKGHNVNVIVADDGMQHYALGRQAEIVMIDARWRTGNNLLMPAGPLREPLERLNEVDLVVFKGYMHGQQHYQLAIDEIQRLNHSRETKPIADFRSQKVVAMAGIANPDSFFSMLAAAGLAIVKHPLPDHHQITAADFEPHQDSVVLITEKDAVKCAQLDLPNVWVVKLKITMPEETTQALSQLVTRVMQ